MLVILSGLPGTGKTTLARALARRLAAAHLRIDTIEQTLRDAGMPVVADEGYRIAYALAEDNLRLGLAVVADSVNPLAITREAWHAVAARAGAKFVDVECVCSDGGEHRRRVETRKSDVAGLKLPTWDEVTAREYDEWNGARIVVDTARETTGAAVERIRAALGP